MLMIFAVHFILYDKWEKESFELLIFFKTFFTVCLSPPRGLEHAIA